MDAMFKAIMGNDDDRAARIEIAKQQRVEYGLKEWNPDVPTEDATGQKIVFKDRQGYSYTVHEVRPNGAHVRHLFVAGQPVQAYRIEARAPTYEEAETLAMNDAVATGLEVQHDSGGSISPERPYAFFRVYVRRPSLD